MKNILRSFAFLTISALLMASLSAADLWTTDYQAALKKASQEKKLVLLDFTGSNWCPWCIKLEEEVFSQKAFKEYAEKNLVLVLVDFPQGEKLAKQSEALQKQNRELQTKYGIEGYPTLVLLDPKGEKVTKKSNYLKGGPEAFMKWIGR
jgi:protein disulfide-isomerase